MGKEIRPLPGRACVKAYAQEENTISDVSLTNTDKRKTLKGEIIAIGDVIENTIRIKSSIGPGDKILFYSDNSKEINVDNEISLIIPIDDIVEIIYDDTLEGST